jgi:hypothetical protein
MCCGPNHIGPPPGWHQGTAEVETLAEARRRQLAALASVLMNPADPRATRRGRRPQSTEGGQGRAAVSRRHADGTMERGDWISGNVPQDGHGLPGGSSVTSWVSHPPRNPLHQGQDIP